MSILREIYDRLIEFYGSEPLENWWPDDPLEVVVGAVLVPGANWKTVARVLKEMKAVGILDFRILMEMDFEELAACIRPVGFQRRKASALQEVLRVIDAVSGGNFEKYFARDFELVRNELLGIKGIGTAAADNILLYAGKMPVYMVDPFTVRILTRHGIASEYMKEKELQHLVHQELTHDSEPYGATLFHAFQALVVRVGRDYCEKSVPACWHCPLQSLLPPEGAVLMPSQPSRRPEPNSNRPISGRNASRSPKKETAVHAMNHIELSEIEKRLLEQLSLDCCPIDTIIQRTGCSAQEVQSALCALEFRRLIRRCEGNSVVRIR